MLRYLWCLAGLMIVMLGVDFRVIDGGSVLAYAVCTVGVLVGIVGVVPDLILLGEEITHIISTARLNEDTVNRNKAFIASLLRAMATAGGRTIGIILVVVAAVVGTVMAVGVVVAAGRFVASEAPAVIKRSMQSPGFHRFEVNLGKVLIVRKAQGISRITINRNDGLTITSGWQINPGNDFGYDLYDVEVSRDSNKLEVFMQLRRILAAYLRGEYD